MDIKEKFYAKLDEISGAKARKSEHASAEVYHRAYDDETRKRRKAIKDKTPESKEAAEKAAQMTKIDLTKMRKLRDRAYYKIMANKETVRQWHDAKTQEGRELLMTWAVSEITKSESH